MRIEYKIIAAQEDLSVRGNACVSGDDAADRAIEDEIYRRLDAGDVWAWAFVTVEARIGDGPEGSEVFIGRASLGGCNYADEAAFRADAYFDDLKREAYDDLRRSLREAGDRGELADRLLYSLAESKTRQARKVKP